MLSLLTIFHSRVFVCFRCDESGLWRHLIQNIPETETAVQAVLLVPRKCLPGLPDTTPLLLAGRGLYRFLSLIHTLMLIAKGKSLHSVINTFLCVLKMCRCELARDALFSGLTMSGIDWYFFFHSGHCVQEMRGIYSLLVCSPSVIVLFPVPSLTLSFHLSVAASLFFRRSYE